MLADLKIANKLILISEGELYHLRGSKIKVVLINRDPYLARESASKPGHDWFKTWRVCSDWLERVTSLRDIVNQADRFM